MFVVSKILKAVVSSEVKKHYNPATWCHHNKEDLSSTILMSKCHNLTLATNFASCASEANREKYLLLQDIICLASCCEI
jgi:hypothetical protein